MAGERHLLILAHDVRLAVKSLTRSRTFTLAAVAALALGIGAGTAVFSVVDRILFRSLPYPQAGRLVSVGMVAPIAPQEFMLSYDYLDWRDQQTPFESMGSWVSSLRDCDLNDSNPVRLRCAYVDSSLLRTLEVQPVAGRGFTRQEETPNAAKTVMISYGLWQSRFGGDRGAVGRSLRLDGQSATLVGVLPPDFELPTLEAADILAPHVLDEPEQRSRRTAILLTAVARLKPGIGAEQAARALGPLFAKSLEAVTPSFRKDVRLRVRTLRERQVQDSRTASWILLGAVLAVLLIACANVANLLLARAATREREFAVRAALGASRGRLVREALTESTLLALIGGAAGCALAGALLRFFVAIAPGGIPHLRQAAVDVRVLLFALLLSLVSGMLFGVVPAMKTPRLETLSGGRGVMGGRVVFRQFLVALQIGISLVLLAGAALLLRSLWNLQNQPLGIRADHVMTAAMTLGRTSYPEAAQRLAFFEKVEERLRRIPGAAAVALAGSLPPAGNPGGSMLYAAIDVRGRPRFTDGTGGPVEWRSVTPDYFQVLRIPILQGRAFREEDRNPGSNLVILSDRLARRLFPGDDPVGKEIRPGRQGEWLTVAGVAANVKNHGLVETDNPEYYVLRKHSPENTGMGATAMIRSTMAPEAMARLVQKEIAAVDATLPVKIEPLEQRIGRLAERPRFNALLLAIFAGLGALLAAIGLYGVISFVVAQRAQEIGVRMALGATPGAITRLVLGQAALWTMAGAAAGALASVYAVRLLDSMLFQVTAEDPRTFAGAAALLLGVGLVAAWTPSRRAAQVDPMRVLRRE